MPAAPQHIQLHEASTDQLIEAAWRAGQLSWKLHASQREVYDRYRAWEKTDPLEPGLGQYGFVFVLDIARRWGKSFLTLLLKLEDAIRHPGSLHSIGCAHQKDIRDIILPLATLITADAPRDLIPQFHTTSEGQSCGLYFPSEGQAKGSRIALTGLDKNPDGLRGRYSDGVAITEAALVKQLLYTVVSVVIPQFQGHEHARVILESSAPEDIECDYEKHFVPDARLRGAHVFKTIYDNPLLPDRKRDGYIRQAGGLESRTCKREYLGIRSRDPEKVIFPEFAEALHVREVERPKHADAYVSIDWGFSDKTGILWGYWDFENSRLVIERDFAERNQSTTQIATVIKAAEAELWTGFRRWDGKALQPNPYIRTCDSDLRLHADLWREHRLLVTKTNKGTGAKKALQDDGVNSLRGAFSNNQIVIHPSCLALVATLIGARWTDKGNDYERSDALGHADLADALVYMWKSLRRRHNATPPAQVGRDPSQVFIPAQTQQRPLSTEARALEAVLGLGLGRNAAANTNREKPTPGWQKPAKTRWQRR